MDETINKYNASRENIEHIKELLRDARAEARIERRKIVKSKINTSKAKVGNFFKRQAIKLRNSLGLLPLNIAKGYNKVASRLAETRHSILTKRIERRTIILSKINTAKAKVGNFKQKIVNGFKNAINKVRETFSPTPEKRDELLNELKKQREELEILRAENKKLRDEGTYKNLSGRSKGNINYSILFSLSLLGFAMFASVMIWLIIK